MSDPVKERCAAATVGPWEARWASDAESGCYEIWAPDAELPIAMLGDDEESLPDAEFIAHARTDVPALLDTIDHYRLALERIARPTSGYHDWRITAARAALDTAPG